MASLHPITIGLAVARYRLYDIDRLISRAFVYGALTAIVAGLFTASVTLSQRMFVALTGESSDLAIVLTTQIAAASYTPLRRRLESLADRYLKYDTPRFGAYRAQLRSTLDVLDPNAVADRLVRQIVGELGAVGGRVELALGREGVVAEAGAPIGTVAVSVDLEGPGGPLGRVVLGPRASGQRYRDDEIEAIGDKGETAVRYPPGYPVLLAGALQAGAWLNLSSASAIDLFIWLCFGLSAGVIFLISTLLWQSSWYGILPAVLWMTYPFALWMDKQPNSEVPFTLFFLLSVYFLILSFTGTQKGVLYFLLSGLLAGLAMMVRPIGIALGIVLVIFWAYYSQGFDRVKKAGLVAVFLLFSFLPAALWGMQIHRETGEVVLLSTGGLPSIRAD